MKTQEEKILETAERLYTVWAKEYTAHAQGVWLVPFEMLPLPNHLAWIKVAENLVTYKLHKV